MGHAAGGIWAAGAGRIAAHFVAPGEKGQLLQAPYSLCMPERCLQKRDEMRRRFCSGMRHGGTSSMPDLVRSTGRYQISVQVGTHESDFQCDFGHDAFVQPGMWGGTSAVLAPPPDLAFAQQVLMNE